MRFILSLIAMLALSACFGGDDSVPDRTPDYRYRLTVEVDTPEGLRTGSSVIEVQRGMGRTTADGFGQVLFVRAYGEAVAVDLPGGKTLYALLRSGNDLDWATRVVPLLVPDQNDENRLDDVLLLEGERELPRRWSKPGPFNNRSSYPMLVTFGDETDPTSVMLVDPDDLAASFGERFSLTRVTAELTNDEVTTGIERRLEWLPDYYDKMLDGRRIHTIDAENRLANDLTQGAFSKGLIQ